MRAVLVAVVGMVLPVLAQADPALKVSNSGWSTPPSIIAAPVSATLLQLLTSPTPYDQRYIRVMGVLSVDFEDQRLYFSKEFYSEQYAGYAIDIRLPAEAIAHSKKFQGQYVLLEGTFTVKRGRAGIGELEVTSLLAAESAKKRQPR